MIELLGFIAGFCTTAAFVPQVVQSWKTRDLSSISLPMYAVFTTGIVFWIAYGIAIRSWPVVIFNVITLLLAGSMLAMLLAAALRKGRAT